MRVHLVHAHPSPTSYSAALRRHVVEALRAAGHEIDELGLHGARFDPAMGAAPWTAHRRRALDAARAGPLNTWDNRS